MKSRLLIGSRLRLIALTLALAMSGALPTLTAQDVAPWRLSYFPYLTVSPNDGMMGIARVLWFQQAGWGERITLRNSVALEAGYSTRDAWLARVTWANPTLAEDWRMVAHAEVGHEPRFGDPDNPILRDRALAWVDVTRRLAGPLHLAVRGGVRHTAFFEGEERLSETDPTVRAAVVVDLRDREFEVNRGVLLEGGMIAGLAGEGGYNALYTHLRGWYNPLQYLRVTGRFGWRQPVSGNQHGAPHEFPGWEGDFTVLGGHRSFRGLGRGQFGGEGVVFAGAEARFDLLNVGEMGALTVLAFADGGKPLHADDLPGCSELICTQSDQDWRWGMGGGIALRVLRAATLTITASGGDGETRWYVGSGWSW